MVARTQQLHAGLRDQLRWAEHAGYVEAGWSLTPSEDSVLFMPTGGVLLNYSYENARLYLSGLLVGAQGRERTETNVQGEDHDVCGMCGVRRAARGMTACSVCA